MNTPETIVARTNGYTLTRIDDRFFLAVHCGQGEIRVELNSQELRDYSRWGEYFVDGLARKIARLPEAYAKRHTNTQE